MISRRKRRKASSSEEEEPQALASPPPPLVAHSNLAQLAAEPALARASAAARHGKGTVWE